MTWNVEYTDEFGEWWDALGPEEQVSVAKTVGLLEIMGPNLSFPHSSAIQVSKVSRLRELRIQHQGEPYRVLYAFDPRKSAILLIGGNKKGNDRWYEMFVPLAERLYQEHLDEIRKED